MFSDIATQPLCLPADRFSVNLVAHATSTYVHRKMISSNHRKLESGRRHIHRLSWLIMGLLFSQSAHAYGNDLQRGIGAAAGIFAGIYAHELGHAAVFSAAGAYDIHIRVPGPQCALLCGQTDVRFDRAPTPAMARTITVAGFMASNLSAELLLRHESAARSGFGQGFIATNLYSNLAHVATYYTKVRGRDGYRGNDIDSYELAGGNPHLLSAGLIAYSVYAVRRMHKKSIPIMFVGGRF